MLTDVFKEFVAYVEAGGWVMPPLVAATLVLWFSIGYRFAALKRGTVRDVRNLVRRYDKGKEPSSNGVLVRAQTETTGPTGVEMEAMAAASVAALTLYDMLKALERGICIERVQLVEKRGGRSGTWRRAARGRS